MLTIEQIRAARALLDWSQSDLADQAGLSQTGIARIENGTNQPNTKTIEKIMTAFDLADIEFIDDSGVKKRTREVRTLKGARGFKTFLDDVYNTAIKYGTKDNPTEVFLSNVVHENWVKWMGADQWAYHTERMTKDKALMDVRIIIKEDDKNCPASAYAEYKCVREEFFNDKSFYSYHNKLAFLNFEETDVEILVIEQEKFAEGYRNLFKGTWDYIAKNIKN